MSRAPAGRMCEESALERNEEFVTKMCCAVLCVVLITLAPVLDALGWING